MAGIEQIVEMLKAQYGQTTHSSKSHYKCEKCHDNGWIEEIDDEGRKYCKKCSCTLAREAEHKLIRSGLADVIEKQTFDSFKTVNGNQRKIKDTAKQYLDDLMASAGNHRHPWMYIGGNPGSGKTHICTAICGELLKKNIGVLYMQWVTESRALKSYINDASFDDVIEKYVDVSMLYIDDLLKQKWSENPVFSDADIKIAFAILNARYLRNKPTIISGEWDLLDQLLPADEGVFSRVYERCKGYTVIIPRSPENNYRLMGG